MPGLLIMYPACRGNIFNKNLITSYPEFYFQTLFISIVL